MKTQQAVVTNKDIWLPPLRASLPNVLIVANNIPTIKAMGKRETKGEGIWVVDFMLCYLFCGKGTTKIMAILFIGQNIA